MSTEPLTPMLAESSAPGETAATSLARTDTPHTADEVAEGLMAPALGSIPLQLAVRVPLPRFRVQDLLALAPGKVFESAWPQSEDLPVWSGGVQLLWAEFEVVEKTLAVRVTRVA